MSVAFDVGLQNGVTKAFPLQIIGIIQSASGYVTLTRDDGPAIQVNIGDFVCLRDIIETAADAQIGIWLLDDTVFNLASGARVALREFASETDTASRSTIVAITSGSFAFAAGRLANSGTLTIDTPLGSVRGRSYANGFGLLTMAALTFSMVDEAQGSDPDATFLDNDTLTYKDLQHGAFELITKERVPRHIIVDDPGETVILNRAGSSISVNQVTNSATRMEELHAAQQDVLTNLTRGATGSSTPPAINALPLQHINFNSDNSAAPLNLLPAPLPPVDMPLIVRPPPTLNVPAGPTEIDTTAFDDTFSATTGILTASSTSNAGLTYSLSGGTAGITVLNGETYDFWQTGPYGILYLNSASGAYAFVPNAAAINALSSSTTMGFVITVSDGEFSSSQTFVVNIQGVNDTAIISGTTAGAVVEAGDVANSATGAPSATGTLTDTDVDNPPNTFTELSSPTRSAGGYGTFTMTAGGVWTYTLDDSNSTVQALNVGDTLTDTLTVTSIDGTPQIVTITIQGSNDAAVISGATTGSVVEASSTSPGVPIATGTLFAADVDNQANAFVAVSVPTASQQNYGSFTITAAGVWTYLLDGTNTMVQALNNGNTLTDSFTVTAADGTAQLVTITINGSNDGAIISGTATGSVIEAGGVANGTPGAPIATGTLTDADPDNTANTFIAVTTPTTSAGGFGTFTMTALGTWTYTLDNANATVQALNTGDTLIDQFTVTTIDGTPQLVTITINGSNDAAFIAGTTTGSVLEAGGSSSGAPVATGTLTDTDLDNPANIFTAVTSPTASDSGYGTFTMTASGLWTYTLDNNNSVVQALNNGDTLTDSFTVTAADGTAQLVTITINGSNDGAIISGTATGSVIEAGGAANGTLGAPIATGTLTDADPDNTANTFIAVTTPTTSAGGFGTFTMTALGTWTYTLDNANATVQALNVGNTLIDQFTVTTIDGTPQLVTITINGSNDAAFIAGTTTGSVLEAGGSSSGAPVATGTLTDTDLDNPANTFTAVTSPTASDSGYGTFTMTASGLWTYTLDNNNSVVDALVAGETLTDHFTVTTIDGTTQEVTIAIHGASDADPNDFDDLATGSTVVSVPPFVYGTPGSDSIAGGGSVAQIVYGGAGDDTLNGTGVNDTIFGGSGNDTIKGNNGADVIYGGSGQDTIDGSNENDTIIGGVGADKLTGGNGDDVFVYLSVQDSSAGRFDTINDFTSGTDRIDLTALGALGFVILALSSTSTSVPPHTIAWIYDSSANETVVYVNPTDHTLQIGDSSLLEVHLQGVATIDSADFIVDQTAAPALTVSAAIDPSPAMQSDTALVTTSTSDASTNSTDSSGTLSLDESSTAIDVSYSLVDQSWSWSRETSSYTSDETATQFILSEPKVVTRSMDVFRFTFEQGETNDGIHTTGIGSVSMAQDDHAMLHVSWVTPGAFLSTEQHVGGKTAEAPGLASIAEPGNAPDTLSQKEAERGGGTHADPVQTSKHGHAPTEGYDEPVAQSQPAGGGAPGSPGNAEANPHGLGDSFKFLNPVIEGSRTTFSDDSAAAHDHHERAAAADEHGRLATDVSQLDHGVHVAPGLAEAHAPHDPTIEELRAIILDDLSVPHDHHEHAATGGEHGRPAADDVSQLDHGAHVALGLAGAHASHDLLV
ncbi:beta strand repeat-containing protein [Bradyrhizobium guangxiense]|uniref:beta strand repeat-containing protein n=1 Tax=Bradyrhizobium guangxiense TaxID=1325115 RepID=UPI00100925C4|nr:VCBS domain-containing protein [Bradyrhizobium guangxiense]